VKTTFEKYKFVDTKTLIAEIENDLYHFSLKLQAYSKIPHFHYICLKVFLSRKKLILALKSLMFLKEHAGGSYEYIDALLRVKEYLKSNEGAYTELAYTKVPELKFEHDRNKLKNLNTIEGILEEVYQQTQSSEKNIESLLSNLFNFDRSKLRHISSMVYFI
jgi:hypothetical protein